MKRIGITGSSGYIGSRLASALLDGGQCERILGLDLRAPAPSLPNPFCFVAGDVTQSFAERFRDEGIDAAVHLAVSFGPGRDRRAARAVSVEGTRNFLEACRAADVKRAIVLSSATAYGARRDNPAKLPESAPLRAVPSFPYAYDKRLCDELCSAFQRDHPELSLAWLRPPLVVGAAVDNYISRMMFKPKVVHVRGCDPPMQFIHEDDLCAAILTALASDATGPFNVAPDDSLPFTELAAEFKRAPAAVPAAVLRLLSTVTWLTGWKSLNEMPPGAMDYIRYPWVVNGERFRAATGFTCRHSSLETVRAWRRAVVARAEAGGPVLGKIRI